MTTELQKDLPLAAVMPYIKKAIERIYISDSRECDEEELRRLIETRVMNAIEAYRQDQMPDIEFEIYGNVTIPFTVTITAKSEEDAEEKLAEDVATYIDEHATDWYSADVDIHSVTREDD